MKNEIMCGCEILVEDKDKESRSKGKGNIKLYNHFINQFTNFSDRGGGRGRGRGHGGGYGQKRRVRGGRPRVYPKINYDWDEMEGIYNLNLTSAELEALRLVDKENLTQEEAARPSYVHSA